MDQLVIYNFAHSILTKKLQDVDIWLKVNVLSNQKYKDDFIAASYPLNAKINAHYKCSLSQGRRNSDGFLQFFFPKRFFLWPRAKQILWP